jgi:predicted extracellular nuclease
LLQLPVAEMADFERLEGMRVTLHAGEQPLVVNETYELGRYGSFLAASERLVQYTQRHDADAAGYAAHRQETQRKSLVIDVGSSYQNPWDVIYPVGGLSYANTLRSGYTIGAVTGVLNQRYGTYRIQPLAGTELTFDVQSNPRSGVAGKDKSRRGLRVASFNVLNYFNTFEGCRYGIGGEPADCRGAESAEEFARQRTKIINAYAMEDPVRAMEDAGFTNVLARRKGTAAYTYVFDGESGTLDYAFAGTGLNGKITSVTVWHSNTDELIALDYTVNYKTGEQTASFYGSGPFRASDHDPVIVDFEL